MDCTIRKRYFWYFKKKKWECRTKSWRCRKNWVL